MQMTASYSSVNYGFAFLSTTPSPDKVSCTSTVDCPIWDGNGIYLASSTATGATMVSNSIPSAFVPGASCLPNAYMGTSPGLVAISEVCRLARQGAISQGLEPKRCLLALGGWSDFTAIGTADNARSLAKLIAKAVLFGFLDGVDLDFEHLTPFNDLYGSEFVNFAILINSLRTEFDALSASWYQTAADHKSWYDCTYNALESWQKPASYYYPTNIQYMNDILANPIPYLEITWTTRFNVRTTYSFVSHELDFVVLSFVCFICIHILTCCSYLLKYLLNSILTLTYKNFPLNICVGVCSYLSDLQLFAAYLSCSHISVRD